MVSVHDISKKTYLKSCGLVDGEDDYEILKDSKAETIRREIEAEDEKWYALCRSHLTTVMDRLDEDAMNGFALNCLSTHYKAPFSIDDEGDILIRGRCLNIQELLYATGHLYHIYEMSQT